MADLSKTPMKRAEFDATLIRNSRVVLAQSYRLLRDTDALLAGPLGQRSVGPGLNPKPRENDE